MVQAYKQTYDIKMASGKLQTFSWIKCDNGVGETDGTFDFSNHNQANRHKIIIHMQLNVAKWPIALKMYSLRIQRIQH